MHTMQESLVCRVLGAEFLYANRAVLRQSTYCGAGAHMLDVWLLLRGGGHGRVLRHQMWLGRDLSRAAHLCILSSC